MPEEPVEPVICMMPEIPSAKRWDRVERSRPAHGLTWETSEERNSAICRCPHQCVRWWNTRTVCVCGWASRWSTDEEGADVSGVWNEYAAHYNAANRLTVAAVRDYMIVEVDGEGREHHAFYATSDDMAEALGRFQRSPSHGESTFAVFRKMSAE